MTDTAVDASRPVVGSSRNKTDGDIINSIPMLVRFRSPPEIPRMNSFPTCDSESEISKGQGNAFSLQCFLCKRMLTVVNVYTLLNYHNTLRRKKESFYKQTGAIFSP